MKTEFKLPNGMTALHMGDAKSASKAEKTFATRHEVAVQHCRENGWPEDPAQLTVAQIMAIRALPSWREAGR